MLKTTRNLFITTLFIIFSFIFPIIAFTGNPPDLAHSGLSVSSAVPADGQTQATVTITLKNTSGIAVERDSVVLKSPNDSTAVITPTSIIVDSEGHAIFKITSRSPGTYKLNVIDTTTNTAFNGLGNIIFNPTDGQYPCTNPVPGSTPQLTLAETLSPNRIALIWTKSSDPVSHYLVAYGLSPGQYQYGNPRIGGRDTTSFIIDSLSPNTKYYFIIKAVNGCTPGNGSNELSATTSVVTETAFTPTQSPTPKITNIPSPTVTPPVSSQIPAITAPTPTAPVLTSPPQFLNETSLRKIVLLVIIVFIISCIVLLIIWSKKKTNSRNP